MTTAFAGNETIATIYLGGGTPSLLDTKELNAIFNTIHSKFLIASDAEITLEANPDDISPEKLRMWKHAGINRLSIGIQSFFEEDLKWMNRAHDAQQAIRCISEAQDAGFSNLSIDLIYGTPTLPDDHWQWNVEKVIGLGVPHISCYALTVEPKTALQQLIRKHKMQDTDHEQQARQFLRLIQWLTGAGYEHYEISNFSLPGRRSRHNTSYWQGKPYYGFGPSAHSFNGIDIRSWNIANNASYIKSIREGVLPVEKEVLTEIQKINEYIMTSLRTIEGIDLDLIRSRFGEHAAKDLKKKADRFPPEHVLTENSFIRLTHAGKLFADGIAAELFEE